MIDYDFDKSIGYFVCTTAQQMENALNEELRSQGITYRQWQVLACLALMGEVSQGDIAEKLGIESATLVGVLDRMERDGWIRRHRCTSDRRRKLIRPTRQVDPVWAKMIACARRVRARAARDISPDELAIVLRVLEQVQRNLSEAAEPARETVDAR